MFALGRGVFTEFLRKDEYSVLLLGLDGAGKSTYADAFKASFDKTFVRRHPSRIVSTVGLNHLRVDCGSVILNVSDVGGHKDLQSLWSNYIDETNAIIFIIDGTDELRLDEALEALQDLLHIERVTQVPFLVLLNKCEEQPHASDDSERCNGRRNSHFDVDANCSVTSSDCPNFRPKDTEDSGNTSSNSSVISSTQSVSDHQQHHHRSLSAEQNAERIRSRVFECLDAVATDAAILSISALENLNVHKSALWILNAILERKTGS